MSEADKKHYDKVKADPVLYAAYLDRKRRERAAKSDYETERKRKWRAANPAKARTIRAANHAVERALEKGRLVRPDTCSRCGEFGIIEGHHPSYARDQWLVVVWLCVGCHHKEHYPEGSKQERKDQDKKIEIGSLGIREE